jgi:energy-coupling factor transport system permease protein
MMKDISIGRYYQGDSVLHNLDPRVKIILCFFYMVTVFLMTSVPGLLATFFVVAFLCILSAIPIGTILRSVRPIAFLLFFIMILNVFTISTGHPIFTFSFIRITDDGVLQAGLMALRLLLLILSTSILLTLTTTPLLMADSLESLFGPLKRLRVPVHEMAMMMSIALRFVPTLVEETDKIMKAQASRGAEYDTGNVFKRAKGYVSVLVPLFVSAFKRAEELAIAMDARCYRGGEGRTKLHVLHMKGKDYFWMFFLSVLCIVLIFIDFFVRIR